MTINEQVKKDIKKEFENGESIDFYKSIVEYLKESREYGRSRSEALKCAVDYLEEERTDSYEILEIVIGIKLVMDEIHYP